MSFELLSEKIKELIKKRFRQPTLPQKLAIPKVLSGKDVLIVATTGSGKTEAALLPILDKILQTKAKEIAALYITPLRALNRDLLDRIIWWCNKLGLEVDVRHGDTSAYRRRQQVSFPPSLLITTPETLQAILVGKLIRKLLSNVKWVVIDEVHEIFDSKRGIQLALSLERLRKLTEFQLIMLSATLGNCEEAMKYFGGKGEIIRADVEKKFEIKVVFPKPDQKDLKISEKLLVPIETAARLRKLCELVDKSTSCLIFTNTRETAEILASRLRQLGVKSEVHHSSLGKVVREKVEKEFKDGKIKSIVCTSSLQLGIDIGRIDLVIQYSSPRQVVQLLQRVGRSGHALEKTSKGIIIAIDEDDAFEAAVIAKMALEKKIESFIPFKKSLDVLAHQIVGMLIEGERNLMKIFRTVSKAYPYRTLSFKEFFKVCEFLQKIGLIYLNRQIKPRRGSFEFYFSRLSTIPTVKQFNVVNIVDNKTIGKLDEEFVVIHCETGVNFVMKGEVWRVVSVENDKVIVEPSEEKEAAIPSWEGELIPVPFEVARGVSELRRFIAENLERKELVEILTKKFPVSENLAKKMVNCIKKQLENGVLPTFEKIVIEQEENLCVIHACYGSLVNNTIATILSGLLKARVKNVECKNDAYRIYVINGNKELVKEILEGIEPESIEMILDLILPNTRIFEHRFLHVARRFGVISEDAEVSRGKLRKLIEELKGEPPFVETLNEIKKEKFDIEKTKEVFRLIRRGKIKIESKLGLSYLSKIGLERRVGEILVEESKGEILEIFKERLLSKKFMFVCMNCGRWYRTLRVKDVRELKCDVCGAKLIAPLKKKDLSILKFIQKGIRGELGKEEKEKFKKILNSASLFMTYGKKYLLTLAARGVGLETAKRILQKYYRSEREFLRELLNAERKYLLTKKFWKI